MDISLLLQLDMIADVTVQLTAFWLSGIKTRPSQDAYGQCDDNIDLLTCYPTRIAIHDI